MVEQVIILILVISFSPVFYILVKSINNAKQRKAAFLELSALYTDELSQGAYFPVCYASGSRFHKIWKLFAWEDYGILSIQTNEIRFYTKDKIILSFPAQEFYISWVGVKYWPNGILSWFFIHHIGKKHYFTSDTGRWTTQSRTATREIYEKIKNFLSVSKGLSDSVDYKSLN